MTEQGTLKFLLERMGINIGNIENDFTIRFETQKRIRLLQLHPELSGHLDYDYSIYLRGPYSPSLARDYYGLAAKSAIPITLSEVAKKFLGFVSTIPTGDLELLTTVVQVRAYSPQASPRAVVDRVREIKPQYSVQQIADALGGVQSMRQTFGLVF